MKPSYRPELDGLRAVAVLAVALHHSHVPGFAGGGRGVDVFFVLSGYLITQLLLQRPATLGEFWFKRAVRLMPALLAMLAAYVVLAPWLIPADAPIAGRDALLSATYLFDFYQAFRPHETALGHMWSLAIEAQFYLVWPLAMRWIGRQKDPAFILLLGWTMSTLLRVLAVSKGHVEWAYLLPFTHSSGLWLGAALAYLPARRVGWLGLAGVAVVVAQIPADSVSTSLYGVTLAELATAAVILGLPLQPRLSAALSWGPLPLLGVWSYGIYLWHSPVGHVIGGPWWVLFPASLAASVGLAALSHRTVETWARQSIRRRTQTSAERALISPVKADH